MSADDENPRPVSRGLKLQSCFFGIDSLYLVAEYPRRDIYDYWLEAAGGNPNHTALYQGILYEHCVVRNGGNGYKIAVWDGDARLYLTDQVNETLMGTSREGQGMGMLLQLGPKWLREMGDLYDVQAFREAIEFQLALFGLRRQPRTPIRLNRIDFALDIINYPTADFSIDYWNQNWVGYANKKKFHIENDNLTGLSIGTAEGAVRFTVYDKLYQSALDEDLWFWTTVWTFPRDVEIQSITRFEWSIRPYRANFTEIQYLYDVEHESLFELVNYASLKWGRLCIPDENDTNRSRWPLSPLWQSVRDLIDSYSSNYQQVAKREYHLAPDISRKYVSSLSGWLSGLQARVALEKGLEEPVELDECFKFLEKRGFSKEKLAKDAQQKYTRISRMTDGLLKNG